MPRFEVVTHIAAEPAACHDLSLTVDAHTASMASSGERAVGGVTSGRLALGDVVTWRARHFGVWFTMTSSITEHEPPGRFVDEQVRGPFRRWWHEHRFEAAPTGGTRLVDTVEFRSPAGPLGAVVDRVFLTRYMTGLIEKRNAWLKQSLERDGTGQRVRNGRTKS